MPELRKDYLTDTWVVISTERSKRPIRFRREHEEEDKPDNCPFCSGNEQMTPPEILAYRAPSSKSNTPGWWVRVIANKYPALRIEGEVDHRIFQVFNRMNGVGAHEVIIESPEHNHTIGTMPVKQIYEIIHAYTDRYVDLTRDFRFRYILIFKNHRRSAGASIFHTHSQLIATPIIPKHTMEETRTAHNYYELTGGTCIFDEIITSELEEKTRVVFENKHFITLSVYAARFPFEVWILPKRHEPHFENMTKEEKWALADMMKLLLERYYTILKDPPYNYYIHTAPCDRKDYRFYHWHIEVTPRITNPAGFERGTGFYINPLPPEDAAKYLRDNIPFENSII